MKSLEALTAARIVEDDRLIRAVSGYGEAQLEARYRYNDLRDAAGAATGLERLVLGFGC